jgi:type IV pilus assembly protein PilV
MKPIKSTARFKANGFTLIEVLVALVISAIGLLGLAATQIKSLQYASNSFDYTISLIQANNAVEKFWLDLCDLQSGNQAYDQAFKDSLSPPLPGYTLTLPGNFSNDFELSVNWQDERLTDNLANQVNINVSFPQLPAGCG